jgi:hypothetical protein
MNSKRFLALGGAAVAALLLLVACDDEPTQAEAEQQFCDDVGAYLAALGELRDVDENTTIDEFDQIRENVLTAHDNMLASAQQLRYTRVDDLEEAESNLRSAIEDIDDDATLQEARSSIEDEVDEVAQQTSQVLNDVDCGSGQGAQERSDE